MFSATSPFDPLIGVSLILSAAFLIKFLFKKDRHFHNHRTRKFDNKLSAFYINTRSFPVALAILALLCYAIWQFWSVAHGYAPGFKPFYIIFGSLFIFQFIVASAQKPFKIRSHSETINHFKPVIIVPVYNESESSLKKGLESFFEQTFLPTEIHVVDDGSNHNYKKTRDWFEKKAKGLGIHATWTKQTNAGKRYAHSTALKYATMDDNTIVVTIDSDSSLDKHAIEEGLKPFTDPSIQSVAGLVVARNAQNNILSRITDLLFVSQQQLIDRAFMSRFGSVLVNSGGLAFYRADVIQKSLASGYLEEEFFGKSVVFSDDSYLTLFALLNGHAIQQPSSIVFADMPVRFSHHVRQQLRWARGSFIRSWWRLRYLSFGTFGYIRQLIGWIIFVCATIILIQVVVVIPAKTGKFPPIELLIIPLIFTLLSGSRYLSIRRSDMSLKSQLLTYLLAPVAGLWSIFILRPIRFYGAFTCYKTGWGTRHKVEIVHHTDEVSAEA
jgi:hyaluronan synthase